MGVPSGVPTVEGVVKGGATGLISKRRRRPSAMGFYGLHYLRQTTRDLPTRSRSRRSRRARQSDGYRLHRSTRGAGPLDGYQRRPVDHVDEPRRGARRPGESYGVSASLDLETQLGRPMSPSFR